MMYAKVATSFLQPKASRPDSTSATSVASNIAGTEREVVNEIRPCNAEMVVQQLCNQVTEQILNEAKSELQILKEEVKKKAKETEKFEEEKNALQKLLDPLEQELKEARLELQKVSDLCQQKEKSVEVHFESTVGDRFSQLAQKVEVDSLSISQRLESLKVFFLTEKSGLTLEAVAKGLDDILKQTESNVCEELNIHLFEQDGQEMKIMSKALHKVMQNTHKEQHLLYGIRERYEINNKSSEGLSMQSLDRFIFDAEPMRELTGRRPLLCTEFQGQKVVLKGYSVDEESESDPLAYIMVPYFSIGSLRAMQKFNPLMPSLYPPDVSGAEENERQAPEFTGLQLDDKRQCRLSKLLVCSGRLSALEALDDGYFLSLER
ncbi:hypothetical protein MHYP_G00022120 [Metynnis hypsauchen]